MRNEPDFIVIDLFAGFGGTSTGFEMAHGVAKVIAAINHDAKAIKSHWINHPHVKHYEEDIRTLELSGLVALVNKWRGIYPNAKVILWASLECTNFSKAKGGQPRDADSRTLAESLYMHYDPATHKYSMGDSYIQLLNPDYIMIENVVEFMCWGPLDECGKPVSRRNGADWMRWRREICELGYRDEWKEMNSANFGAYTSRNRLFGCFAKDGLPIAWPEPTHAKKVSNGGMYGDLQPWKPVKDVLDFADEGQSIFSRKRPLCDKTLEVIAKGLIKSIQDGEEAFLFKYYGNGDNLNSINEPAGTVTTKDRFALILRQYKTGFTTTVDEPLGAIPTNPKANMVSFIMSTHFDGNITSVDAPHPTITANRKHSYIVNLSHGGHVTSADNPCPVIVASQHKAPLYVLHALMDEYGIADIKMRMLKVDELLKIQGFPDGYRFYDTCTQADMKKQIGNSVVPHVVRAWALAMANGITQDKRMTA